MPPEKKKIETEISVPSKKRIHHPTTYEIVALIAGIVLMFLLFYAVQTLITPIIIIGAIIFLLYPLRKNIVAKNILLLSAALFLIWFFTTVQTVLAPFMLSLFVAYLLHPIVAKLERLKIPRWTAALFVILCSLAVIIVGTAVTFPYIVAQFDGILQAIGTMSSQFTHWLFEGRFVKVLQRYGISTSQIQQILTTTVAPRVQDLLSALMKIVLDIFGSFSVIVSGVVNIIILPFLTFYMLKDFPLVKHRLKMLFPRKQREIVSFYYNQIDDIVGRYIRGTTIIAIFDSIAVTIGFSIIGIPYALVLGILSGFLFFIPYFGFITMLIISTVVATLNPVTTIYFVGSAIGYLVTIHIIENFILSPRIIGRKIGLHPIVLLLSIFLFGYLFGFIGLLIAIPAAGSIIVIVKDWDSKRKIEHSKEN